MDEDKEEYCNYDPSSSSRSFSYNLTNNNPFSKRFPLIDLTNEEDEKIDNKEKISQDINDKHDNEDDEYEYDYDEEHNYEDDVNTEIFDDDEQLFDHELIN